MVAAQSEVAGGDDEVKVCVVFKPRAQVAMEALPDDCQERMPYFAVPRYIEFVSELPKTPTGKVQSTTCGRPVSLPIPGIATRQAIKSGAAELVSGTPLSSFTP